jgi:dephospho-CoA kinase
MNSNKLPYKVGITGGIGSGKTTVCKIFETFGVPIFYADAVAKEIMNKSAEVKALFIQRFGASLYNENGLDRLQLANIIFSDSEAKQYVERIVHPLVFDAFNDWVLLQKNNYVLHESAVLIESGAVRYVNEVILVTAPLETRLKRVMERDGVCKETVLKRVANQLSDEEKKKYAGYILNNDEENLLIPVLLDLHYNFLSYG